MTTSDYRMDDAGMFLARELETILARTFEVEYADIKYSQVLPISSEVGPASDSFVYRVFDKTGSMKIIQDKAGDLPRADVLRREVTYPVRSLGASFAYTVQETRAASMVPGLNLEQRRANAVRRAYEEKVQEIAFFGDASTGLPGFFNSSFVDSATASKWFTDPTITTNEMLQLLNAGPTNIVNNSNMRETPDTILMPYTAYKVISTTPRSDVSDTTVMEFFLRTNPYITSIEPINQLDSTKADGRLLKDRMVIYNRTPDKLQLHIAQPLEFFPPIRTTLEYTVAAHARIGGVALYYPKSAYYLDSN